MTPTPKTGKVILAGAGPGDPELLTMKAARFLQNADVVLVDRLVSKEILTNYVSPKAEIIHVGKQCRHGISTPQKTINELMVESALLGKLVVRLKGGDVSVFSNILDELETLIANSIPYEIVPGVTAALGAAAFAGIPLTARGYATSVRFLTYYKSDVVTDEYWKELANSDDTLVFYMSSETLLNVVEKLTAHHIHEDKLLAIIEQATTPFQNVQIRNLYDFKRNISETNFVSPTLIIIGRVVSLHENFKWLENNNSKEYYFKPLNSNSIPNLQTEKITHVS
jgi:uroporphyrin-III C-methyltransferase/precorrin-2 dehydrogenase/sirohydrochlorin ferrochelatase/uroporphyrin-III C-methyltransferase